MAEAGHNNPPGMIDTAGETASSINSWLTDHPVIETEEMAREAKVMIDRGKLGLRDLDDERAAKVAPLNLQVQSINDLYRKPKELLRKITDEALRRVTDFLAKEEAKRIKLAEEARRAAEEVERSARLAEAAEREAIDDAGQGAIVDIAATSAAADRSFDQYRKADKAAAIAEREAKVKIGGGFTRSLSLKNRETLRVVEAISAINAIGLTPDIEAAILKGARAFRAMTGSLPSGIESKTERSA
jgi:hypothetical protein